MKRWWQLITVVTLAGLGLFQALIGSAQAVHVAKNQILVTGVVPERRLVVIDTAGNIQQLFSNTNNAVVPMVTVGGLTGQQVGMTPRLQANYDAILSQLRANHIVSISRTSQPALTIDYPSFTSLDLPTSYLVVPTRVGSDPHPSPYLIAL